LDERERELDERERELDARQRELDALGAPEVEENDLGEFTVKEDEDDEQEEGR
jgi:hypothetical protein